MPNVIHVPCSSLSFRCVHCRSGPSCALLHRRRDVLQAGFVSATPVPPGSAPHNHGSVWQTGMDSTTPFSPPPPPPPVSLPSHPCWPPPALQTCNLVRLAQPADPIQPHARKGHGVLNARELRLARAPAPAPPRPRAASRAAGRISRRTSGTRTCGCRPTARRTSRSAS